MAKSARDSSGSGSMAFTHARYEDLLTAGKEAGYCFGPFDSLPPPSDPRPWCLLRHDCDNDLAASFDLAQLEHRHGIVSTWFVMLRSPMYNMLSPPFARLIRDILSLGHRLGLHFDEHGIADKSVRECVNSERRILSEEFGVAVDAVSFHRPSRRVLDGSIRLDCVNTYSAEDLAGFHYYSDSRMELREGCPSLLLRERRHRRLQLLIHPEWWTPQDCSLREKWTQMFQNNVDIAGTALQENDGAYPDAMRFCVRAITDAGT